MILIVYGAPYVLRAVRPSVMIEGMRVSSPTGARVGRSGSPRRRRRPFLRRRVAALALALIVLAIVATTAYLLSRPSQTPGRAGDSTSTVARAAGNGTIGGAGQGGQAGQEGHAGQEGQAGQASGAGQASETVGTTAAPATVTTNGPPQRLSVASDPSKAEIAITLQDQTVLKGTAPYSAEVPGGRITISLTKTGYNPAVREISLDSPQSVTAWLDPKGLLFSSLVRFKCGHGPKQVIFSRDGKELWVSLLKGLGVEIYDPKTGAKLDHIELGKHGAVEIVFNRAGTRAYVSQMETASVYEIDTATRKVLRVFKTKGSWTKVMLLSPDEKTLWTSNWISNDVSEIDLATGKVLHRIPVVANPRGLYETPDGSALYVAGFKSGEIQKIDLATRKGAVIFKKAGGSMRHMVADDKKRLLYVDDLTSNAVFVVDLATDKVRRLTGTDECPNTMALTLDKKVLIVSNRGKDNPKSYYIPGPEWGSVLALDTGTGKVLDAIVGGNQCTGLDVSPDGKLLAFSDLLDDDVWVYTIPDYATFAAGDGGRGAAHAKDLVK
jgi:YVTN family beta-propeller protein